MNREQKKQETRKRIIDAAMQLFGELGYEAATVAQITERAGVAKGTFFNYFANKEEVILDTQGLWAMQEIVKLTDKPGPIIPRLKVSLIQIMSRFEMSRGLARALIQGSLSSCQRREEESSHKDLNEVCEAIRLVIEHGQRLGEFRTDLPAVHLAQMAVQIYMGVLTIWSMGLGDDDNLVEQMAFAFEVFIDGIEKRT